MEMSTIYWITRLDKINDLFFGLSTILFLLLYFMITDIDYIERKYKNFIFPTISFFIAIILYVVNSFIPTTKEMCAIMVLPKIANSEIVSELGNDAIEIKNYAKDYLKNLLIQTNKD